MSSSQLYHEGERAAITINPLCTDGDTKTQDLRPAQQQCCRELGGGGRGGGVGTQALLVLMVILKPAPARGSDPRAY